MLLRTVKLNYEINILNCSSVLITKLKKLGQLDEVRPRKQASHAITSKSSQIKEKDERLFRDVVLYNTYNW